MLALGWLDGLTTVLPDPQIFLYSYIRKEAVLCSQIEGTQSSLSDLLPTSDAFKPSAKPPARPFAFAGCYNPNRSSQLPVPVKN